MARQQQHDDADKSIEEGGIGRRLRDERSRLGFTQVQVAEFADVSHRTIVSWERGEVKRIPSYNVHKLNAHGFDTEYLLTGERAPSTKTKALTTPERELIASLLRVMADYFSSPADQGTTSQPTDGAPKPPII